MQDSLFDLQHVPAAARGPVQSQLMLDSLGKDTSYKSLVARGVYECAKHPYIHQWLYDTPVTDDDITDWCERQTGRRHQRNVIARTRGLLEVDGWFLAVPDVIGRTGRPTHAVVPSPGCIAIINTLA
jgi:hypothetical protein